jgi:hypothetical protein
VGQSSMEDRTVRNFEDATDVGFVLLNKCREFLIPTRSQYRFDLRPSLLTDVLHFFLHDEFGVNQNAKAFEAVFFAISFV